MNKILICLSLLALTAPLSAQSNSNKLENNSDENYKASKGPRGNTIDSFGFDNFSMGQTVTVKEIKPVDSREIVEINEQIFVRKLSSGISCDSSLNSKLHQKLALLRKKNHADAKILDDKFQDIRKKHSQSPIKLYTALSEDLKKYREPSLSLRLFDNQILTINVNKDYLNTGLKLDAMIEKVQSRMGKPVTTRLDKRAKAGVLVFEGDFRTREKARKTDFLKVEIGTISEAIGSFDVSYAAIKKNKIEEINNAVKISCNRELDELISQIDTMLGKGDFEL